MIVEKDTVIQLMDRMAQIEVESRDTYSADGKRVPRVTEVLSAMLHEDSLMSWANGLGWKRISYRAFMREAADKGTYAHMAVEKYLRNGSLDVKKDLQIPNDRVLETVLSCMDGFMDWWKKLHKKYKKIELIYLEETMVHPYFGGTCDCLLKLDGKYWLVDFKTSNHMNYSYTLQLAAYRFLLREMKAIELSGCMVLQMSKTEHSYSEYLLNLEENKEHLDFIVDCENTFLTLVAAYKMRLYTTEEYYKVFGIEKWKSKKKIEDKKPE